MATKFGDKITVTVTPGLVLDTSAMLEEWLTGVYQQLCRGIEIDLDRETIGMAQKIIARVVETKQGETDQTEAQSSTVPQ